MHRRPTSTSLSLVFSAAISAHGDAIADESASTSPRALRVAAPLHEKNAHAQMVQPFFNELDCENLGYVQPGEVEEHIGPIFISFDVDRSQGIDPAEWRNFPYMRDKQLMALSFSLADRDHDNVISFRELTDYLSLAVAALDSDSDGEVSPAELKALLPAG